MARKSIIPKKLNIYLKNDFVRNTLSKYSILKIITLNSSKLLSIDWYLESRLGNVSIEKVTRDKIIRS